MYIVVLSIGERSHCQICFDSIREAMPDSTIIQITDRNTAKFGNVDEVVRYDFDGLIPPLYLRWRFEIGIDEWIGLDDDIVLRKPLDHLLYGDFDVGLCLRQKNGDGSNELMRQICNYNSGLTISKNRDFWKDAYELLFTYKNKWIGKLGDQIAICDIARTKKYRIKELPGDLYNRTRKHYEDIAKIPDVFMWHYKGDRKSWMVSDWEEMRKWTSQPVLTQ